VHFATKHSIVCDRSIAIVAQLHNHMRRAALLALPITAALACGGSVRAEDITSVYTSTAPKDCRVIDRKRVDGDDIYSRRVCRGVAGYVVVVTEDDLRMNVTVGASIKAALNEPAAGEGFGSFNSITDTVEWRSVKGAAKPFAIIQRWSYADNENLAETGRPKDVSVLIVTRLPPGPVCQVARIAVKAGEDANTAARRAADETARHFKCAASRLTPNSIP
jgi:hypothetical protein